MLTDQAIAPNEQATKPNTGRRVTALAISGMTCNNCARHVTEALQSVPGVQSASVSLEAGQASVRWAKETEPELTAMIKAVEAEGFGAKPLDEAVDDHGGHALAGWQLNLWLGLSVTGLLMLGEWGFGLAMRPWFQWLSFVLAGAVQVLAGARFYRGAWSQLKVGSSNMDTLVALGSTTAFAYSAWALLSGHGGHVYFMEAAAIITLISAGHWMESRVSLRASSALRKLLDLAPAVARRRLLDGAEVETPVTELRPGELVALRPGDRVPTDGEVVEGESVVDESMLTGESAPIDKAARSPLYAGTVNVNGRLLMRVTATGEETALAHIIAAVQRAQNSRANIQRLGDRVSSVFVPVVVALALAAALWWGLAPASANAVHDWAGRFLWAAQPPEGALAAAFIIAAAVLIIACPCAMGLATPAAIMAGSNAAAQRGILIRDGVALEKAGLVTAVVFDKTGTLTAGRPTVAKVWVAELADPSAQVESENAGRRRENENETFAVRLAITLASHSSHPVSQAVARLGAGEVALADWKEMPGAGVQGKVVVGASDEQKVVPDQRSVISNISNQRSVISNQAAVISGQEPEDRGQRAEGDEQWARLGSLRWLRESGVDIGSATAFIEQWSAQGATLVGVALGEDLLGLFAVKDTLKAGARAVVAQLQAQGLSLYLVTGDNTLTARSIGQLVGIPTENVFAEIRPEQKAEFVKKLQGQGRRVAFVGDGINDAPALEQSDLGIAVSRASDIAREAADIILLKSEIEAVPESLGLARATLRAIKQNLFWAFFYNAVGIPLAALGFMSPILCAAAMGLSDLVVIGNALRLRTWRL